LNLSSKELKTPTKYLNAETEAYFKKLSWGGNIRQLRNICHWLTVMAPGREIGISDLPQELLKENVNHNVDVNWDMALSFEIQKSLKDKDPNIYELFISKVEKLLIKIALSENNNKKNQAAASLGIGRNTITRKIKDLDI
jgi:two-component system nitrogen regulation response regulator GlnG